MTETHDMQVYHKLPFEAKSVVMALSILIERIGTLPKADRDDLFELVQELRTAEDQMQTQAVVTAMEEILAQKPITARPMPDAAEKNPKEQPWVKFISAKIRDLRIERDMTQKDLADAADLTQSHISRIENGTLRPNNLTLTKIARGLGIGIRELDPCTD